jgi:hypothetical protein
MMQSAKSTNFCCFFSLTLARLELAQSSCGVCQCSVPRSIRSAPSHRVEHRNTSTTRQCTRFLAFDYVPVKPVARIGQGILQASAPLRLPEAWCGARFAVHPCLWNWTFGVCCHCQLVRYQSLALSKNLPRSWSVCS